MLEISKNILNIFNSYDTKWKGTFKIKDEELSPFRHMSNTKDEVLFVSIETDKEIVSDDNYEYAFCQWGKEENFQEIKKIFQDEYIQNLKKKYEKDFSFCPTPTSIYFFIHNFRKKYKTVEFNCYDQKVLNETELYIIKENDKVIFAHNKSFVFSLKEVKNPVNGQIYDEYNNKLYEKIYHGHYKKDKDYIKMYDSLYQDNKVEKKVKQEEQLELALEW